MRHRQETGGLTISYPTKLGDFLPPLSPDSTPPAASMRLPRYDARPEVTVAPWRLQRLGDTIRAIGALARLDRLKTKLLRFSGRCRAGPASRPTCFRSDLIMRESPLGSW